MTQKVLKVGSSAAVTLPKKSLEDLGIKIGDQINVRVNAERKEIIVQPKQKLSQDDERIARLTAHFIDRYRKDLEALARK